MLKPGGVGGKGICPDVKQGHFGGDSYCISIAPARRSRIRSTGSAGEERASAASLAGVKINTVSRIREIMYWI